MAKYRRKPDRPIEAEVLTERTEVETFEGVLVGEVGDYLITAYNGDQYPLSAEIFEAAYEIGDEE